MAISSTSTPTSVAAAVNVKGLADQLKDGAAGQTVLTASGSVASALSALTTNSAQSDFNLAFNQLQNTVIDRLNAKIKSLTDAQGVDHQKEALLGQREQLVNVANALAPVQDSVVHNSTVNSTIGDLLGQLNNAAAAADSGDPSAFNALLSNINTLSDSFTLADGSAIGLMVNDGTVDLKKNGVIRVTQPDGTTTKASSFSDFASTADALSAITDALYRDGNVYQSLSLRADTVANIMDQTQTSIGSIDTQISANDALKQADMAGQVAKLKQDYGLMLQNLSYAFSGSQSMVSALNSAINGSASQAQAGSVVNLFT